MVWKEFNPTDGTELNDELTIPGNAILLTDVACSVQTVGGLGYVRLFARGLDAAGTQRFIVQLAQGMANRTSGAAGPGLFWQGALPLLRGGEVFGPLGPIQQWDIRTLIASHSTVTTFFETAAWVEVV